MRASPAGPYAEVNAAPLQPGSAGSNTIPELKVKMQMVSQNDENRRSQLLQLYDGENGDISLDERKERAKQVKCIDLRK